MLAGYGYAAPTSWRVSIIPLRPTTRRNNRSAPEFRPRNQHGNQALEPSWKIRLRSHIFRIWTAAAILAAYVYAWVYTPETLTWWKRTTATLVEAACSLLPYPWNDRIEATLGNFGLWVQVTLAIIAFRILVWLVIATAGRIWRARQQERSLPVPAETRQ